MQQTPLIFSAKLLDVLCLDGLCHPLVGTVPTHNMGPLPAACSDQASTLWGSHESNHGVLATRFVAVWCWQAYCQLTHFSNPPSKL